MSSVTENARKYQIIAQKHQCLTQWSVIISIRHIQNPFMGLVSDGVCNQMPKQTTSSFSETHNQNLQEKIKTYRQEEQLLKVMYMHISLGLYDRYIFVVGHHVLFLRECTQFKPWDTLDAQT